MGRTAWLMPKTRWLHCARRWPQLKRNAIPAEMAFDTATELVSRSAMMDVTRQELEKARKLSELSTLNAPAAILSVGKVSWDRSRQGQLSEPKNKSPLFTLIHWHGDVEGRSVNVTAEDIGSSVWVMSYS